MKRFYTFLLLIFALSFGNAQIVNIPDADLKAKLLSANNTNTIASTASPAYSDGIVSYGSYTSIDSNSDGEIQMSEAALIKTLKLNTCFVGTKFVDLTGIEAFVNLTYIDISCNNITNLNLNNPLLKFIECQSNNLQTTNFSQLPSLKEVRVTNSSITIADFSFNPLLTSAQLPYNPDLEYIFIKNTSIFMPVGSGSVPIGLTDDINLKYICAKESEVQKIKQHFSNIYYNGIFDNLEVNTYCSFNPGGTFYTVQGNIRYDSDNNGCSATDITNPNLMMVVTSGTNWGEIFPNNSGAYSLPVQAGTHTITPFFENPTYFNVSPANANITFPASVSPYAQDFCITANGIHKDLEIMMFAVTNANPGFDAVYKIVYKNKGTNTQSGTINMMFDDSVSDFVAANPVAEGQTINNLSWSFNNLASFESREILVSLNLNAPYESPALNSGDVLTYSITIAGDPSDENPIDNTLTCHQNVVNSLDPNDKTCVEGTTVSPSIVGTYVHYVIRFENTGTANAQNIVVRDMIDTAKYDINSLSPICGSAPFTTRVINTNQVEFIFQNINLPFDAANNDGYVVFKIKTKPTLVVGDTFSNSANIYFDYNFPITTNTATTTIASLGIQDFDFSSIFSMSPIPTKNVLTITTKQNVLMSSVHIYNALGQIVQVSTNPSQTIDVSGLKTGNYFIRIFSDKGTATGKFLKE